MNINKDSYLTGIIIGVLLPLVIGFIISESLLLSDLNVSNSFFEKLQLFLFALNAIVMRQFIINRNQDKIGKGILLVTLFMVFLHFIFYYTSALNSFL